MIGLSAHILREHEKVRPVLPDGLFYFFNAALARCQLFWELRFCGQRLRRDRNCA